MEDYNLEIDPGFEAGLFFENSFRPSLILYIAPSILSRQSTIQSLEYQYNNLGLEQNPQSRSQRLVNYIRDLYISKRKNQK
jgi:hypothetical protein